MASVDGSSKNNPKESRGGSKNYSNNCKKEVDFTEHPPRGWPGDYYIFFFLDVWPKAETIRIVYVKSKNYDLRTTFVDDSDNGALFNSVMDMIEGGLEEGAICFYDQRQWLSGSPARYDYRFLLCSRSRCRDARYF